jgi:hypothetical protein
MATNNTQYPIAHAGTIDSEVGVIDQQHDVGVHLNSPTLLPGRRRPAGEIQLLNVQAHRIENRQKTSG